MPASSEKSESPVSTGLFALLYAERGWPVLPLHTPMEGACSCRRGCGSPGKHPRTMNGSKDATTGADKVRQWWDMWPDANVGIATGVASHNAIPRLQVLDVERYAFEELERVIAGREWPRVPTVYTGGGGLHFYFAGNGRNSVKAVGDGLDVRGAGGFVVAPPSLHVSGEHYAWIVWEAIPQVWPEWLTPPAKDGLVTGAEFIGHGTPYAKAALENEVARVASTAPGKRNHILNEAVFAVARFVGKELSAREVAERFLAAALTAGLGQDESTATIKSALEGRLKKG